MFLFSHSFVRKARSGAPSDHITRMPCNDPQEDLARGVVTYTSSLGWGRGRAPQQTREVEVEVCGGGGKIPCSASYNASETRLLKGIYSQAMCRILSFRSLSEAEWLSSAGAKEYDTLSRLFLLLPCRRCPGAQPEPVTPRANCLVRYKRGRSTRI